MFFLLKIFVVILFSCRLKKVQNVQCANKNIYLCNDAYA